MASQTIKLGSSGCSITVSVPSSKRFALERTSTAGIQDRMRTSADALVAMTRARAPARSGDLRQGIIRSPNKERSANPDKVVYDVYMDEKMNDTFVKMSKAGKRYYYPASLEYGFRIGRVKRKPGLYYMRTTAEDYTAAHAQRVSEGVDTILEDL